MQIGDLYSPIKFKRMRPIHGAMKHKYTTPLPYLWNVEDVV